MLITKRMRKPSEDLLKQLAVITVTLNKVLQYVIKPVKNKL